MTERRWLLAVAVALLLVLSVGLFARGLWTPDEPREADLAWRMTWQTQKSVPLLAGEAFCEKPPLTYWAAALPAAVLGFAPWSARLPNLLYALITLLSVGLMARRMAGPVAGLAAGAAIGTFLLGYQTLIWLATDAPALAFVSLALLGLSRGFYAGSRRERWTGYALMYLALAGAFLSKSALGLLVPALALITLIVLERRWRELLRWELWAGLPLALVPVLIWVWAVYSGPNGPAQLKIFFWNNLAGRLTQLDAPPELQYALAHRNSPGKYLGELPLYLWPWTLLVIAAARRAWLARGAAGDSRALRVAAAASLPAIVVLSFAATARNVYLAPALPGFALLVGWWVSELPQMRDHWDVRALRATAALIIIAAMLAAAALTILAFDSPSFVQTKPALMIVAAAGLGLALYTAADAWINAPRTALMATASLFFGFCCLLSAPCWLAYTQINRWQDLSVLGTQIRADLDGAPLILLAPDETTRAFVDLYVSAHVAQAGSDRQGQDAAALRALLTDHAGARILAQVEGRNYSPGVLRISRLLKRREPRTAEQELAWALAAGLRPAHLYALPNGRRYALFESVSAAAIR
ncbi:MAG: glycosyltransferase family 39 protein [Proteobacteria bacterium]|nr:glycosyltransferase family 39 protein [Pseudomonadota bacterium]